MQSKKNQSAIESNNTFMVKMEDLVREIIIQNNIPFYRIESLMEHRPTEQDGENNYIPVVRVITYFEDSVNKISDILLTEFDIANPRPKDKKRSKADNFSYKHLQFNASLKPSRQTLIEYRRAGNKRFDIQVCSMLQDAWAGIERELGYENDSFPEDMKRDFYRVGALLEMADLEFLKIRSLLNDIKLEPAVAPKVEAKADAKEASKDAAAGVKGAPTAAPKDAAAPKGASKTTPATPNKAGAPAANQPGKTAPGAAPMGQPNMPPNYMPGMMGYPMQGYQQQMMANGQQMPYMPYPGYGMQEQFMYPQQPMGFGYPQGFMPPQYPQGYMNQPFMPNYPAPGQDMAEQQEEGVNEEPTAMNMADEVAEDETMTAATIEPIVDELPEIEHTNIFELPTIEQNTFESSIKNSAQSFTENLNIPTEAAEGAGIVMDRMDMNIDNPSLLNMNVGSVADINSNIPNDSQALETAEQVLMGDNSAPTGTADANATGAANGEGVNLNIDKIETFNMNVSGMLERRTEIVIDGNAEEKTVPFYELEEKINNSTVMDENAQMTDAYLKDYVAKSRLVKEVDAEIARRAGATLNNDVDVEGDVERLRFLKVYSLKQLHERITDNKNDIIAFAEKWIGKDNGGSFDSGICLFYLEYLLVGKRNDPAFAVEYVLKFISDNDYSARFIIPTYNAISKADQPIASHLTLR